MKIIKIEGIRGLLTAAFCVVCAFAGFVIFPAKVIAHFWNLYLVNLYMFPHINLFQGGLLWLMTIIVYGILIGDKGLALSFQETPFPDIPFSELPALSDKDIEKIINNAKMQQQMNKRIINSGNPFDIKEEDNTPINNTTSTSEKKNASK